MPSAEMPALVSLVGPGYWSAGRVRWRLMREALYLIAHMDTNAERERAYTWLRAWAGVTSPTWWLQRRMLSAAQLLAQPIPPVTFPPISGAASPAAPSLHPRPDQLKDK